MCKKNGWYEKTVYSPLKSLHFTRYFFFYNAMQKCRVESRKVLRKKKFFFPFFFFVTLTNPFIHSYNNNVQMVWTDFFLFNKICFFFFVWATMLLLLKSSDRLQLLQKSVSILIGLCKSIFKLATLVVKLSEAIKIYLIFLCASNFRAQRTYSDMHIWVDMERVSERIKIHNIKKQQT